MESKKVVYGHLQTILVILSKSHVDAFKSFHMIDEQKQIKPKLCK
jgi:hypothetical protein